MSMPNTTDSACPIRFEENVANFFFDKQCVANMRNDTFECPMETVNLFVEDFMDGLCIDSSVIMFSGMVALVILLQLGGIPTACGPMGTFLWVVYMNGLILQWLAQLCSLVMIIFAFLRIRDVFEPCLQPWKAGMSFLDIVALVVFPFAPIVLSKLLLMLLTFAGIVEAVKVFYASKGIKCGSARVLISPSNFAPAEIDTGEIDIDEALFYNYFVIFVVLPCCNQCADVVRLYVLDLLIGILRADRTGMYARLCRALAVAAHRCINCDELNLRESHHETA